MELTFLGTSCMVPTKERNVSAVFLNYKSDGILFDCGEGTQRQMNICGIKRTKVSKILLSHWHGDHVSGLIGLIQTLGNDTDPATIEIYGPIETKMRMAHMMETCIFDQRVNIKIHEIEPKGEIVTIFENDDFILEAAELSHKVPTLGFSFIEKDRIRIKKSYIEEHKIPPGNHMKDLQKGKDIIIKGKTHKADDATYISKGKKIAYIADTIPCKGILSLSDDADLMISEAAYSSALENKAEQYMHMTAKAAGMMANEAGAKRLVLTHFSQRYRNTQELADDARDVFDNVECAEDFMKITL